MHIAAVFCFHLPLTTAALTIFDFYAHRRADNLDICADIPLRCVPTIPLTIAGKSLILFVIFRWFVLCIFFFSAWVSYYLLAGWLPVDCLFCFFFFFYMSLLCNTFLAIVCHSLQHYEFLRHIRTHMHSYLPPELCAYPTNRHHQHHIFFFLQIPLSVHAHIHTHTHTNIVKRDICSPVAARLQLTALYTISFFYIFSDTNVLPRPLNPSAHEFVAVHLSNFLCCQMCS